MNIKFDRTDLRYHKTKGQVKEIAVEKIKTESFYTIVSFPTHYDRDSLIETLIDEYLTHMRNLHLPKRKRILVVGLGNDAHTADSIGPKILEKLQVNAHLKMLGITPKGNIITALEPGVLGRTGIETRRIVEAVTIETKPDIVVLLDALVTDSIFELCHSIVITDEGLAPGSGLKAANFEINEQTLGVPVLTIGIPTALEVCPKGQTCKFLMSPADIDTFVGELAEVLARSLNKAFLTNERC